MKSNNIITEPERGKAAIIYCRVSSADQVREGTSLEVQEAECKKFATKHGIKVLKVFVERGVSAKSADRPTLKEALNFCQHNVKRLNYFIVHKIDRFCRNTVDHFAISAILAKYGIELWSATEPINDSTPSVELMRTVLAGFAQFDNDVRGQRAKAGMIEAVTAGHFVHKAPYGYRNAKRSIDKKPKLIIHDEEAFFVREAFLLASKGVHRQSDILRILDAKGFKTASGKKQTLQNLNKMLRRSLYAGTIKCFGKSVEAPPHLVPPIIDKTTYYEVQSQFENKNMGHKPRNRNNPDFPFRGLVRCHECGKGLTGSWTQGKSARYPYYHCRDPQCKSKNIKRNELETDFVALLEWIKPKKECLDQFDEFIRDIWTKEYEDTRMNNQRLTRRINETEENIEALTLKNAKGVIDDVTYKKVFNGLERDLVIAKACYHESQIEQLEIEEVVNFVRFFIENIDQLWKQLELNQKQVLFQLIFPKGLVYQKKFNPIPETSPVFEQINALDSEKLMVVGPRRIELRLPG